MGHIHNQQEEAVNVNYLSKVTQRKMCNFESYGMSEMIMTGSFNKEMLAIDMSTECVAYYFEQERRRKRVELGLEIGTNDKCEKEEDDEEEQKEQMSESQIHAQSYGLMGKTELSNIMTSCSVHPKSLYTVCGTLNNCMEIVACASNPFMDFNDKDTVSAGEGI